MINKLVELFESALTLISLDFSITVGLANYVHLKAITYTDSQSYTN